MVVVLVAGVVVELGVVVVVVELLVLEGVVVVLELVVDVLLVVDGVVVVVEVGAVVLAVWQSRADRLEMVLTPCSRFDRSVGLIEPGRFDTALLSPETAFPAAPH